MNRRRPTAVLVAAVLTASLLAAALHRTARPPAAATWKYDVVHQERAIRWAASSWNRTPGTSSSARSSASPATTCIASRRHSALRNRPHRPARRRRRPAHRQACRPSSANARRRSRPAQAARPRRLRRPTRVRRRPGTQADAVGRGPQGPGAGLPIDLLPARLRRPAGARAAGRRPPRTDLRRLRSSPSAAALLAPRPTTILLTQSLNDYRALVAQQGRNLFNPAYFDPAKNQIVCASDIQRLADALEGFRRDAQKALDDLKDKEKELAQAFGGRVPPDIWPRSSTPARSSRLSWRGTRWRSPWRGGGCCNGSTTRPSTPTCPTASTRRPTVRAAAQAQRGVGADFETAIVEVGELRVGRADPDRLDAVHHRPRQGTLLPTAEPAAGRLQAVRTGGPRQRTRGVRPVLPGVVGLGASTWPSTANCSAQRPSTITSTPSSRGTDRLEAFRRPRRRAAGRLREETFGVPEKSAIRVRPRLVGAGFPGPLEYKGGTRLRKSRYASRRLPVIGMERRRHDPRPPRLV